MLRTVLLSLLSLLFAFSSGCVKPTERLQRPQGVASPEQRAVDYLATEVPRWVKENACYSCHNNGDAVRALMTARHRALEVTEEPFADTLRFLASPDSWDANNKGDPVFSDKQLARIQFASALVTASELGFVRDRSAVERAAHLVGEDQHADGSWHVGPQDSVGSPATYGRFLSTRMALRTLRYGDKGDFGGRIERAEAWLRRAPARSVLDAAAVLLALGQAQDPDAMAQKELCLNLIRRAQGEDSGWGPYVNSPAEVFDTAVVLLAIAGLEETPELSERIARGRSVLLAMQEPGGGWPETTRPSGSESYALHISTTGWATLALLATRRSGS